MPIGLKSTSTTKKKGTTLSRSDSGASGGNSIGGSSSQTSTTTVPRPVVTNPTYSTSGATNIGGLPATTTTGNAIAAASGSPQIQQTPIIGNPVYGTGAGAINRTVGAASQAAPVAPGVMPGTGGQGQYGGNTDPLTGWLGRMGYTSGDVMGNNQMPAKYLYDILQNRGMDPSGGLFYMMEPLADIMMPLYEVMNGTGTAENLFNPESIGNFMGNMWKNFMTPGGRLPQQQQLINNLLGTVGTDSVLGGYLNVGTPEERVENLRRYLMLVGNLSGSPMYQQALSNVLSQGGYGFLDQFQGGNQPTNTFGQYLTSNYGPLFGF